MVTARSATGDRTPSERRHVGLTMPRIVKDEMVEAASLMNWSAGDWVLAIAAEQGPGLREHLTGASVRKRPRVVDATFTALYLTPEEREELDDQAIACGLNRSAFVTAVAQLGLGGDIQDVLVGLIDGPATSDHTTSGSPTSSPPHDR